MVYFLLAVLLLAACIGWASCWFTMKMLTAWIVMNRLRMPNDTELKECAKVVRRYLFRRKK